MKLYQAEWCPFSHRVRAKLTELGIDYELVNVPASSKQRKDLEKVAGTTAIPVLVDGRNVISDSDEALAEADIEVLQELDLSSALGRQGAYKVLIAADLEFLRLAAEANPGAATLELLKNAVYEEDGSSRVDAVEPEKGVGQIRSPQLNDRGLELRKRFIKTIKSLERADARV